MSGAMKKVLFYGDSNTYGFDPRNMGGRYTPEYRWPDILMERYRGRLSLVVDGLNGREIPYSPLSLGAVDKWIRREAPVDLFGVMLGSNDLLTMAAPDVQQVAWKMERFLRHLLGNKKDGLAPENILLMAPPVMELADVTFYQRYDTADGRLSRVYYEVASELGVGFFDGGGWEIPMAHDHVHLSELGHETLAEIIDQEVLRPLAR